MMADTEDRPAFPVLVVAAKRGAFVRTSMSDLSTCSPSLASEGFFETQRIFDMAGCEWSIHAQGSQRRTLGTFLSRLFDRPTAYPVRLECKGLVDIGDVKSCVRDAVDFANDYFVEMSMTPRSLADSQSMDDLIRMFSV